MSLTPEEIAAWRAKAPEREAVRERARNINRAYRSIVSEGFVAMETPTGPNGESQILFVHDDGRQRILTFLTTEEGATVTELQSG